MVERRGHCGDKEIPDNWHHLETAAAGDCMKCAECGKPDTDVIDSRAHEDWGVRRRRKCSCGTRFTTYEMTKRQVLEYEKAIEELAVLKRILTP